MSADCTVDEMAPLRPRWISTAGDKIAGWRTVDPKASVARREDWELVGSVLDGDEGAFERLYAQYSDRIYRFAVSRLRDPVEAEDVVQDTFLEIHRCLGSWEGRSRLLSWMFGIAHHQICRRFRKKTPISLPIDQIDSASAPRSTVSSEARLDAVRALNACASILDSGVSPSQREIFDRYYGESQPMKEIAKDLGKTSQAVKISLFRTRREMAERLALHGLRQAG